MRSDSAPILCENEPFDETLLAEFQVERGAENEEVVIARQKGYTGADKLFD